MTWLDRSSKTRFGVIAKARGVSESALLRQLVETTLMATRAVDTSPPIPPVPSSGRISVRLRTDDLLFLRERASARELPTSTYASAACPQRICDRKFRFRRRNLRLANALWLKLAR